MQKPLVYLKKKDVQGCLVFAKVGVTCIYININLCTREQMQMHLLCVCSIHLSVHTIECTCVDALMYVALYMYA